MTSAGVSNVIVLYAWFITVEKKTTRRFIKGVNYMTLIPLIRPKTIVINVT